MERLRGGAPVDDPDETLVRVVEGWEREHRAALAALARPPDATDPATLDEEERPAALQRRVDELRGRLEGFVKALALTRGHDTAARIEAEARRRLEEAR